MFLISHFAEPALLVELLQRYFDTFGDKAVCYEDLLPYISLDGDELAQWSKYLDGIPQSLVSLAQCDTVS